MDDDDFRSPSFFISYHVSVKVIRLLGSSLLPSSITINLGIERTEDSEDSEVELGINKTRYWFENIVSRCVAVNQASEIALALLIDKDGSPKFNNPLMLCPDDPRDEVLAALFQAKAQALGSGAYEVVCVDIESDTLKGLSFSLGGDHSIFMPKTVEEWIGQTSFFETPWWGRDDASTFDLFASEDVDTSSPPAWAYSLDFLDSSTKAIKAPKSATVYKFKPVVINCGDEEKK